MDQRLNSAPCGYLSLTNDGTILRINQTLLTLLEYSLNELIGQHVDEILPISSRIFYQTHLFPLLVMEGKVEELYLSLKSKTSMTIPVLINAVRQREDEDFVNNFIVISIQQRYKYEHEILIAKKEAEKEKLLKDEVILELEKLREALETKQQELTNLNQQLYMLATTDSLTGLHNRRSLDTSLASNMSLLSSLSQPLSLVLLDIDHFKAINDKYGHLKGDVVLKELATVLQKECRKDDIIARYGGEEFAVVLPGIDQLEALLIAENLRFKTECMKGLIPITISIGVATMTPIDTTDTLLDKADSALYSSKQNGRNRITHFFNMPGGICTS